MKCTREFDYAVMTMAFLARMEPGQVVVRREIAERLELPDDFLAKILKKLNRAGLVKSFKGVRGGYTVGRAASRISLADIVDAIDGPVSLMRGFEGRDKGSCEGFCLCDATDAVKRVEGKLVEALEGIKLTELVGDGCGGPVRRYRSA